MIKTYCLAFAAAAVLALGIAACGDGDQATVEGTPSPPVALSPEGTTSTDRTAGQTPNNDAGDTGAIESATRALYDSVLSGDLQSFEALLSENMSSAVRDRFLNNFSLWQQASDSGKDSIRISDLLVRQQDGTAEVDVTFKGGLPDTVHLSFENGHWRITDVVTRYD